MTTSGKRGHTTQIARAGDSRRWPITACIAIILVVFGLFSLRAAQLEKTDGGQACAPLTGLVFSADFEDETAGHSILEGAGIAGSRCLDLRANENATLVPFHTSEAKVLESLSGSVSFTVTGWFQNTIDLEDSKNGTIVHCPGMFTLLNQGQYKGRLLLNLYGADGRVERSIGSSWFKPFLSENAWVFLAVTYDGRKEKDNVSFYVATESAAVQLDSTTSANTGVLGEGGVDQILVGARDINGTDALNGLVDSVRLFSSKDGAGAALSLDQLEALRQQEIEMSPSGRLANAWTTGDESLATLEQDFWNKAFNAAQVDSLDRVFSDVPPKTMAYQEPVSVARGGNVAFQFAAMSRNGGVCSMEAMSITGPDGSVLRGDSRIYDLKMVPVEANNNGGSRSGTDFVPPGPWLNYLIRKAPFDVGEAMLERDTMTLQPGHYAAALLDVSVSTDALPGHYTGTFRITCGDETHEIPFSFYVHATVLPDQPELSVVYWFSHDPKDVSHGNPPAWWSERHWKLIENSARVLHDFGQDSMFTPLIDGKHPLIQVTEKTDGTFTFDFTKFDRWVELHLKLGIDVFEGHHTGGGHSISVPPMRSTGGIWVQKEGTGDVYRLLDDAKDTEPWFAFLPLFYTSLHKHLSERGWIDRYVQCQLDEPRDQEEYRRLSELARTYLPGIKTKDAINGKPRAFSPLVDIHVFSLSSLAGHQDLARERRQQGLAVWLYHCCSPYPPFPNRHLDEALAYSRVYPWLAYLLDADGYLYWAANIYRGADPYVTSIGPLPNGSQNPGHPPGDNWFFYPTNEGLVPSLRMVAFRDGLDDHSLLVQLAKVDQEKADAIMRNIAPSVTNCERTPAAYHQARRALLEALDSANTK
jgi:hypothetical protein